MPLPLFYIAYWFLPFHPPKWLPMRFSAITFTKLIPVDIDEFDFKFTEEYLVASQHTQTQMALRVTLVPDRYLLYLDLDTVEESGLL